MKINKNEFYTFSINGEQFMLTGDEAIELRDALNAALVDTNR